MPGYFLNMIPVRTELHDGEEFAALVRRVRGTVLAAFDHSGLPFPSIAELAASRRKSAERLLFRQGFVLLEQGAPTISLGETASRGEYPDNTGTAKCDLSLFVYAEGETWECRLEYSTDLFSRRSASKMCEDMVRFFAALTETPSVNLP